MHIYTCIHLCKKPYFCHSSYHIIYLLFSHNKMTKERLVCYAKAAEEYIKNISRDQLGKQNLLSIHSKLKMLSLLRLSVYLS